jgi:YbbR domain-containing protein
MNLPEVITKDLRWKLISLLIAAVIWVALYDVTNRSKTVENPLSPRVERTFTRLPVRVISFAADVREVKVQPDTASVTIRATQEIMAQVTEGEIKVHVDLSDIESARNLRKRLIVSTPAGVTFLRVEPAEVEAVVPPKKER